MTSTIRKLNELIDAGKKVKRYRDIRLNPEFLKKEKKSVINLIIDEEVLAILKEDNLYLNSSIGELMNIRNLIFSEYDLSNESVQEIDFDLLLNGKSDSLVPLRIYKEINYLVCEEEVKEIASNRFINLINEYVKEDLSDEELEEIEIDCIECIDEASQDLLDEEIDEEVTNIVVKRVIEDEILSNYVILLDEYLTGLDTSSKEYKDILTFIQNMFFVNKNLERRNEYLYNKYSKNLPLDEEYLAHINNSSVEKIEEIKNTVLLDFYDYVVEKMFDESVYENDTLSTLISIYLTTVQSMLSKDDIHSLFTIIDDNYLLAGGIVDGDTNISEYTINDKIKTKLENNIYLNEEKEIRGKTYIKR